MRRQRWKIMAYLWALCVAAAARVNAGLTARVFKDIFLQKHFKSVAPKGIYFRREKEVISRVPSQKSSLLCDVLARKTFSRDYAFPQEINLFCRAFPCTFQNLISVSICLKKTRKISCSPWPVVPLWCGGLPYLPGWTSHRSYHTAVCGQYLCSVLHLAWTLLTDIRCPGSLSFLEIISCCHQIDVQEHGPRIRDQWNQRLHEQPKFSAFSLGFLLGVHLPFLPFTSPV